MQPRVDHDDAGDTFLTRPNSSENPVASPENPTSVSDTKETPAKPPVPPPRVNLRTLSSSGFNFARSSRGISEDLDPFRGSGVPPEFESSTDTEYCSAEGVSTKDVFHEDLAKYVANTTKPEWTPVVFLVHDLGTLEPLHAYLSTCVGIRDMA